MRQRCKVIECTELGWLAGWILADLGAWVVTVDQPETNRFDPHLLVPNINKCPVTLDFASRKGIEALDDLVSQADIVIAWVQPGTDKASIFDYERPSGMDSATIVVLISPLGLDGPCAHWRATDLELMAGGGAMLLAGGPEGVPLGVTADEAVVLLQPGTGQYCHSY